MAEREIIEQYSSSSNTSVFRIEGYVSGSMYWRLIVISLVLVCQAAGQRNVMEGFIQKRSDPSTNLVVNVVSNVEDLQYVLETLEKIEQEEFFTTGEIIMPLSNVLAGRELEKPHKLEQFNKKLKRETGFDSFPLTELTKRGLVPTASEEMGDFLRENEIVSSPTFFILTQRRNFILTGRASPEKLKRELLQLSDNVNQEQLLASSKVIAKSVKDKRIGKVSNLNKPIEQSKQHFIMRTTKSLIKEKKKEVGKVSGSRIQFKKPPLCTKDNRRRRKVSATNSRIGLDILVYDPADSWQVTRASKWNKGLAVPFPKDMNERREQLKHNPTLGFLLINNIQCLPTRYHAYREGDVGYVEYTEGKLLVEKVR